MLPLFAFFPQTDSTRSQKMLAYAFTFRTDANVKGVRVSVARQELALTDTAHLQAPFSLADYATIP